MPEENKQSSKGLSEWEKASFWSKWTFSVTNPLLKLGEQRPIQFDDLYHIQERFETARTVLLLKNAYKNSKAWWFIPRLMVALFRYMWFESILVGLFTFIEASCMVISPLLLQYLLKALESSSSDECYMWAGILSGVGLFQVIVHHSLFFISMRMGWTWKNTCTALIHDKLIGMDTIKLQSSGAGTGMMVNLISNDVARFEEFAVVRLGILQKQTVSA